MSDDAKKRGATHARAREDADAGVRDCVDLMVSGNWVTGVSDRLVAEKHGVSPATVKNWATNASRIIRLATAGDVEDIRARMLATLETIVSKAMNRQAATMAGELYDNPDLKAAIAAVETQAKLLGLVVQKHEVQYTEEQARARYRELTGVDWQPETKPS